MYMSLHLEESSISLIYTSGDVAPVSYKPGPKRMLSEPEQYTVIELLLANPGIYLDELQQELHQSTGTWASISTIFHTLRRLDFTRKRLRHVALQQSDTKRAEFMEEMGYFRANMIVWLDETGSDRRMHVEGMDTI